MPKFCGKCGSKLDEKTNLCPKCDTTEIAKQKEAEKPNNKIIKNNSQQNRPANKSLPAKKMSEKQKKSAKKKAAKLASKRAKKADKKAKKAARSPRQKAKAFLIKLVSIVLALIIVAGAVYIALACNGVINSPLNPNKDNSNSSDDNNQPSSDSPNGNNNVLKDFKADTFDIRVSESKEVLFTVNIDTSVKADEIQVQLITSDDNLIGYMNDNGEDGDITSGDGVYSLKTDLKSDLRQNVVYLAQYSENKSNSFEICFYEDISSEDYKKFDEFTKKLYSLRTVNEAVEYIKKSDIIADYSVNGKIVTYTTKSGITGVYEEMQPGFKGSGSYAVPESSGVDYSTAQSNISKMNFTVAPSLSNGDTAVIRPFRGTQFKYDDFLYAGNCISQLTKGKVERRDDSTADISFMKSLSKYKFVLFDSHGTLSDVTNSAWDVFPTAPYLLTGELYSAGKMWSSADWQAKRIVVCGTSVFYGNGNVAVGAGFFDKYYKTGDLKGSMFFLGTCYSMHDNSIAEVLYRKGASVVYGYTEPVTTGYCNKTLFETVINSMILSGSNSQKALETAKKIYGEKDPNNTDEDCVMKMYGDSTYTMVVDSTQSVSSSSDRDIMLVLDTSGSMSGTPISETRKAAVKFVDTILDSNANIGIVTYNGSAKLKSDFSNNKSYLESVINDLDCGGSTNIDDGLCKADEKLSQSSAKKKIIVLMSDGMPNEGRTGDNLVNYAEELKQKGIYIYTLGFFEKTSDKTEPQALMEKIASEGCHYEVSDADSLVFFFGDIADQISGQKYIYVRIACPVDVSVTHNGETLNSSNYNQNTRTSFGTLTFEETDSQSENGSYYQDSGNSNNSGGIWGQNGSSGSSSLTDSETDSRVKILRLKEGEDYDIKINGNGFGTMNYSIGFMNENGDYSDFRRFNNISINSLTRIDTVAKVSDKTVLNVDENGDGKYDVTYEAKANSYGEIVDYSYVVYIIIGVAAVVVILILVLIIGSKVKKRRRSVPVAVQNQK